MPTYQYKCPSCSHEFEEFQSMADDAIEKCPACGAKTRRLISGGAGLIFKGSGFYTTDYRSEGYKKDSRADSAPAKTDKSGQSNTESKNSESKKSDLTGPSSTSKPSASDSGGSTSSGSSKSS